MSSTKTTDVRTDTTSYLIKRIPRYIYTSFQAIAKKNKTTVRAMLIDHMAGAGEQPRYIRDRAVEVNRISAEDLQVLFKKGTDDETTE